MNVQLSIDNPFSDPSIPSLKTVKEQIEFDHSLSYQRRMDMVSAINKVGSLFNLPLSAVPASAEFFRQKFAKINSHSAGISKRRLGNVKSLLMSCLRQVGLSTKFLPYQAPLSREWQLHYDKLTDKYVRSGLSRFMKFCSKQGVRPADVKDQAFEDYHIALDEESLVKDPRINHQTACRLWNQMVDVVEGWPQTIVTVPRYDDRLYSIGDEHFQTSLLAEIDAYLLFLGEDILIGGLKRPLRPNSIESTKGDIRRFLSALHHDGYNVSLLRTLADMVEFGLVKRALEWHWRKNDNKTSKNIAHIAWTIRCIAVKHLKCDEDTAAEFAAIMAKLNVPGTGLSEKNKATVAQFTDQRVVIRLLGLPDCLWDLAHKEGDGKKGCLYAQLAVIIEILIFAPMRLSNLQNLRLDRHVNWVGELVHINIPADEVKNLEELHFILPSHLSDRIRQYTERWRDLFISGTNTHLFPGKKGKPKDDSTIRRQIKDYCFKYAGVTITPHQFRHLAAYLLLRQKPGFYEVVRKLLGHKSLATTYSHYAGAENTAAIELYDDVILGLKEDGAESRRDDPPSTPLDPFNPFLTGGERR
jgi:integrase